MEVGLAGGYVFGSNFRTLTTTAAARRRRNTSNSAKMIASLSIRNVFLLLVWSCLSASISPVIAFANVGGGGRRPVAFERSSRLHSSSAASATTKTTSPSSSSSANQLEKTTTIAFSKYHGLGNDFILIDNRDQSEPRLTPAQAAHLCDRNRGIGGDGVIFLLPAPEDTNFDYRMRIYNSDGSEPEMCGNGIRCLAQFLYDLEGNKEQTSDDESTSTSYRIHTLAGPIVPVLNTNDNVITVDMGEPILSASQIPTTLAPNAPDDAVVLQSYTDEVTGKEWTLTCISMGNPHAIVFVQDLKNKQEFDLSVDGPRLETAPIFPAKTNVEFVQVLSPTHLQMQVWERGAGPTLACGTGACALTVAAMLAHQIPRPANIGEQVRVTLPGGDLLIEWRVDDNKVYMTGPATFVFKGTAQV